MKLTIFLLLISSVCLAQIPNNFSHQYDSIYYVGTPFKGKQIIGVSNSNSFSVNFPVGKFKFVVYTPDSKSIDRFIRFSDVLVDSINTTVSPLNVTVNPTVASYLVLVPKSLTTAGKKPILSDGVGTQIFMYEFGTYYYAYIRRTAPSQIFKLDIHQTSTNHIVLTPVPGKYYLYNPPTQILNVVVDPVFQN